MENAKSPEVQAVAVVDPQTEAAANHVRFVNSVLQLFGNFGHGRLWCTCGYLIWTCGSHKDCPRPMGMIETDHSLCTKGK